MAAPLAVVSVAETVATVLSWLTSMSGVGQLTWGVVGADRLATT